MDTSAPLSKTPDATESGPRRGKVVIRTVGRDDEPADQLFVPSIAAGLGATIRHFFKNLFSRRENKYAQTVQYPEEKAVYPSRFRGMHRLVPREDGTPRCVACFMCQTACPADCIRIVAGETDDKGIEKYPVIFEIDELRCVMCGLCVEACPCDAIRMDSGIHPKPVYNRADGDFGKMDLLAILGRYEQAEARDQTPPPATAAGTGRKDRHDGDHGAGGALGGYEHAHSDG